MGSQYGPHTWWKTLTPLKMYRWGQLNSLMDFRIFPTANDSRSWTSPHLCIVDSVEISLSCISMCTHMTQTLWHHPFNVVSALAGNMNTNSIANAEWWNQGCTSKLVPLPNPYNLEQSPTTCRWCNQSRLIQDQFRPAVEEPADKVWTPCNTSDRFVEARSLWIWTH